MRSTFFFFKQKTAYEMRISDWSSDVCSSDLLLSCAAGAARRGDGLQGGRAQSPGPRRRPRRPRGLRLHPPARPHDGGLTPGLRSFRAGRGTPIPRSEDHTSELQSLMRISYAILCLKKKNTITYFMIHTLY